MATCAQKPEVIKEWKMFPAMHRAETEGAEQIANRQRIKVQL